VCDATGFRRIPLAVDPEGRARLPRPIAFVEPEPAAAGVRGHAEVLDPVVGLDGRDLAATHGGALMAVHVPELVPLPASYGPTAPILVELILLVQNLCDNRNILNIENDRQEFIEDMGQHMTGWGISRNTGRVYAYLLVQDAPVSLDQIAAGLGVAKSGVSVATRQLVGFGLARAIAGTGSRRLLYEALVSLEAIFAARMGGAVDLGARFRQGARVAPEGPRKESLAQLAGMMGDLLEEIPQLIRRIKERNES
jgi:hypothetical protein